MRVAFRHLHQFTTRTTQQTLRKMSNEAKVLELEKPRFDVRDIKPVCWGTWAWAGNTTTFGSDANAVDGQRAAFKAAMERKLNYFDTAEIYSGGKSEAQLGRFITEHKKDHPDDEVLVATKFIPLPWNILSSALECHLRASLKRLQLDKVSLYMVHGPAFSVRQVEVWAEMLAKVYKEGLCDAVGVSNYSAKQVRRTYNVLKKHNIQLASNQIEYSLLHTLPADDGTIKECQDLGVTIYAYSALGMGRLTGKYNEQNPPQGNRKFGECSWEDLDKIIAKLREVGDNHKDAEGNPRTPAQVSLAWVIAKKCVPIIGVKNEKQLHGSAACVDFELTPEEVQALDQVSISGKGSFWQGTAWF